MIAAKPWDVAVTVSTVNVPAVTVTVWPVSVRLVLVVIVSPPAVTVIV